MHEYVIYTKDGILFSGKDVLAKNNGYCESGIDTDCGWLHVEWEEGKLKINENF